MGKIQIPKKLHKEDFKPEDQELVDKIGFVYNDFADSVYQTLTKGVDYENLRRQLVTLVVTMDKNAKVTQVPEIKINVNGRIIGTNVINAVNVNNINVYPTGAVQLSYSVNANILRILNITGLQANSQYQLTFELIV